jgi:hypothetical protein
MNSLMGLERCQAFINCHLQPPGATYSAEGVTRKRAVTISRQSGSGGHAVGEKLATYLQAHAEKEERPWTVFDRDLVQKVIEDHHLPERLARFMTEDRISEISDTMDELFGLHPPSSLLVRKISETILRLVELGNVILVGRGGGLITRKLDYVLHVRLVGSLLKRIEHMQALNGWTAKQAREFIEREDRGRRRYLKKYFSMDIDDPLLYHLVINTDIVPYEDAARLIGEAVLAGKREVSQVAA